MKYLILVVLLLFFSCKVEKNTHREICGIYQTNFKELFGEIILKNDYTFVYKYNAGLIKTKSKGTWVSKGDYLILSSFEEYFTNNIGIRKVR